ncbi:hypothetical protein O988_03325 [Pseudogymnoascus sp. VKM F-3808]|nr:hypothetical protein O988_03325 [Pseudogymnoascus sp. VKM F-3808]
MMEESPSKVNMLPTLPQVAGVKRPAPSLLPAFEPLSSSPGFPRPAKRQALYSPSQRNAYSKYPTPVPTSTTGILSSSPPRVQNQPSIQRRQSMHSERAPLCAVPTVVLPENGDEFFMGRSSNSSQYQLSANKLISRIHVKARYIAATSSLGTSKVEIICNGWNGMKVHCHGRSWDLAKGDSFTSETESAEIMLDVQDARVFVAWPRRRQGASETTSAWDEPDSPRRQGALVGLGVSMPSSPLRMGQRLVSPVSPTPAGNAGTSNVPNIFSQSHSTNATVEVYEDASSEEEQEIKLQSPELEPFADLSASQSSELSEASEEDPDEENDPIVHSFGPFGADISSRMAAFTAGETPQLESGRVSQESSAASSPSPEKRSDSESTNNAEPRPFVNHVVNQLAFSRLSSTPLSVILNNLPSDLRGISASHPENKGLTKEELHRALTATTCIGEIHREGKDAAGKQLESEYYYIPDEDVDESRRAAVVDGLRKPSLRNCRKSHKQYYWKKPRTP